MNKNEIAPELFEAAWKSAKQLARRSQHRPEFEGLDREDIEQELILYFLERAEKFDPAKGTQAAFVNRMLKTGIATMIRKRTAKKARPPKDVKVESLGTLVDQPRDCPEFLSRLVTSADQDRRTGGVTRDPIADVDLADAVEHQIRTLPRGYIRIARQLMKTNRRASAKSLGMSKRKFAEAMAVISEHFAGADWLQK